MKTTFSAIVFCYLLVHHVLLNIVTSSRNECGDSEEDDDEGCWKTTKMPGRHPLDTNFDSGSMRPWLDVSKDKSSARWAVEDVSSDESQCPPPTDKGGKYLSLKRQNTFGVAVLRSPTFMAFPGDVLTFSYWIRSRHPGFNNIQIFWSADGKKETFMLDLFDSSETSGNRKWLNLSQPIPVQSASEISLIIYGYCGMDDFDSMGIDDIAILSPRISSTARTTAKSPITKESATSSETSPTSSTAASEISSTTDSATETDMFSESVTDSSTVSDSTTESSTISDSTTNSSMVSDSTTESSTISDSTTESSTISDSTTNSSMVSDSTTESSTISDPTTHSTAAPTSSTTTKASTATSSPSTTTRTTKSTSTTTRSTPRSSMTTRTTTRSPTTTTRSTTRSPTTTTRTKKPDKDRR